MRNHPLLIISLAVVLILACNLPSGATPEGQAAPTATATQTPLPTQPLATPVPSDTPLPTDTPTITPTPTPSIPIAFPKDQPVNCRFGPGTEWVVISGLNLGQTAEIQGKNAANTWWYVNNQGTLCWVSMSVTNAAGNLANIPIIAPPQASVTKVTVSADVAFTACAGPNAVDFSGKITTNGPTTVTFRWEVRGDTEHTTAPETLDFAAADTKDVTPGADSLDCGNYSITLHVLSPNDEQAKKNFTIPP